MVILSDGKVGIGTAVPIENLTVSGSASTTIGITGGAVGSNAGLTLRKSGGATTMWTINADGGAGDYLLFSDTGGDYNLLLQQDGKVGIGTSSSTGALHIESAGNIDSNPQLLLKSKASDTHGAGIKLDSTNLGGGAIWNVGARTSGLVYQFLKQKVGSLFSLSIEHCRQRVTPLLGLYRIEIGQGVFIRHRLYVRCEFCGLWCPAQSFQ